MIAVGDVLELREDDEDDDPWTFLVVGFERDRCDELYALLVKLGGGGRRPGYTQRELLEHILEDMHPRRDGASLAWRKL